MQLKTDMGVIGVIGLGKTGQAVTMYLAQQNFRILGVDSNRDSNFIFNVKKHLSGNDLEFSFGPDYWKGIHKCTAVVVSPGIPPSSPAMKAALDAGIPILSEIELAYQATTSPIIGVTGTNGKTTVTRLIGHILTKAGREVLVGGNIGTPLIELAAQGDAQTILVAELSSFQLKYIHDFKPHVAVILNIAEDHLDWHPDFADYEQSKFLITKNQDANDYIVVNSLEPWFQRLFSMTKAKCLVFPEIGDAQEPYAVIRVSDKTAAVTDPRRKSIESSIQGVRLEWGDLSASLLQGAHNLSNCLAAIGATIPFGAKPAYFQDALAKFEPSLHRTELVRTLDGIRFIDDSKATNVHATQAALDGLEAPIILILGGKDKGCDFAPLGDLIAKKVKHLVLIGEVKENLAKKFGTSCAYSLANSMGDAVKAAFNHAKAGDTVLLSPATSSFDMFKSYTDRGERFRQSVLAL